MNTERECMPGDMSLRDWEEQIEKRRRFIENCEQDRRAESEQVLREMEKVLGVRTSIE